MKKQSARLILLVLVLWSAHLAKAQQEGDGDVVSSNSPEEDEQNGTDQSDGVKVGRMSGGSIATTSNRLYGALITLYGDYTILLSGAIISNTEVLTSASGIITAGNVTETLLYVSDTSSKIVYTDVGIKSYELHSGFSTSNLANDLAIITINGNFTGKNVQPIPIATTEIAVSTTNRPKCVVTGWGQDSTKKIVNILAQSEYELMTDQECAVDGPIPPSIMCARPTGPAFACYYDGGAPLVCNGQLYGILTHQTFCNVSSPPTYQKFTKLSVVKIPFEKPAIVSSSNSTLSTSNSTLSTSNTTLSTTSRKNYVSCP